MERYFSVLENNIVKQVIVSDGKPDGNFVETLTSGQKNYAGIGDIYLPEKENFCSPQPYKSWALDEKCVWQPPIKKPEGSINEWVWNEENQKWESVVIKTI